MTIKKYITPWIFLAPALFFIAVFSIYPLFETIVLSFMKQNRGVLAFAGIENYKRLFSDQYFFISLKNSIIYLIIQVPIMTILSILLAIILHRGITKLKSMYRTAFFVPFIVESVSDISKFTDSLFVGLKDNVFFIQQRGSDDMDYINKEEVGEYNDFKKIFAVNVMNNVLKFIKLNNNVDVIQIEENPFLLKMDDDNMKLIIAIAHMVET